MLEMAVQRGAKKVYIHASLDGRDCPPRSATSSLEKLKRFAISWAQEKLPQLLAASTQWTATTVGIALSKPTA